MELLPHKLKPDATAISSNCFVCLFSCCHGHDGNLSGSYRKFSSMRSIGEADGGSK